MAKGVLICAVLSAFYLFWSGARVESVLAEVEQGLESIEATIRGERGVTVTRTLNRQTGEFETESIWID